MCINILVVFDFLNNFFMTIKFIFLEGEVVSLYLCNHKNSRRDTKWKFNLCTMNPGFEVMEGGTFEAIITDEDFVNVECQ